MNNQNIKVTAGTTVEPTVNFRWISTTHSQGAPSRLQQLCIVTDEKGGRHEWRDVQTVVVSVEEFRRG